MYHSDFKLTVNSDEVNEELFKESTRYIAKQTEKMQSKLFDKLSIDMEKFMYEKFDNVQERYFNNVVSFLLDEDYVHNPDKKKLSNWLKDLGYTQEKFREKIYNDNKEDIIEQISYDSAYELVKNMFGDSYFKHWEFSDINRNYPQSQVVKGFLDELIERDGFTQYLEGVLDGKIKDKLEDYKRHKEYLESIINKIEAIEEY